MCGIAFSKNSRISFHQLSGIDIFQGTEFSAFPGSVILVHLELGGIAKTVTFYHRHTLAQHSLVLVRHGEILLLLGNCVCVKPIVV